MIVGTDHAGASAAFALRQHGFTGSIGLFGKESDPPYERPPLSKEDLAGEKSFELIMLRPIDKWADKGIDLVLGGEVIAIEADQKIATLDDGSRIGFQSLIWAGGGLSAHSKMRRR